MLNLLCGRVSWRRVTGYQQVFRGSAESWEVQQRLPVEDPAAVGPLVGGSDPARGRSRMVLLVHQQQVATVTDQDGGIFCRTRTRTSHEGSCSCLAPACPAGWTGTVWMAVPQGQRVHRASPQLLQVLLHQRRHVCRFLPLQDELPPEGGQPRPRGARLAAAGVKPLSHDSLLNWEHWSLVSPLPRVNLQYFQVNHLEELLVVPIQEDDAPPVYGHVNGVGLQRRSCDADVSEATAAASLNPNNRCYDDSPEVFVTS